MKKWMGFGQPIGRWRPSMKQTLPDWRPMELINDVVFISRSMAKNEDISRAVHSRGMSPTWSNFFHVTADTSCYILVRCYMSATLLVIKTCNVSKAEGQQSHSHRSISHRSHQSEARKGSQMRRFNSVIGVT